MSNAKSMSKQELLDYLTQSPAHILMGIGLMKSIRVDELTSFTSNVATHEFECLLSLYAKCKLATLEPAEHALLIDVTDLVAGSGGLDKYAMMRVWSLSVSISSSTHSFSLAFHVSEDHNEPKDCVYTHATPSKFLSLVRHINPNGGNYEVSDLELEKYAKRLSAWLLADTTQPEVVPTPPDTPWTFPEIKRLVSNIKGCVPIEVVKLVEQHPARNHAAALAYHLYSIQDAHQANLMLFVLLNQYWLDGDTDFSKILCTFNATHLMNLDLLPVVRKSDGKPFLMNVNIVINDDGGFDVCAVEQARNRNHVFKLTYDKPLGLRYKQPIGDFAKDFALDTMSKEAHSYQVKSGDEWVHFCSNMVEALTLRSQPNLYLRDVCSKGDIAFIESHLGKVSLGYTVDITCNNTIIRDLNELPLDVLCDTALKFSEAIEAKRTAELERQEAEQSELAEGLPESHPNTSSREDFDAPETGDCEPDNTLSVESTGDSNVDLSEGDALEFDTESLDSANHTEHDYAAYALYEREIRAALLSLEQAHMAGMSTSLCTGQHLLSLRCSLSEKASQIRNYMETLVACKH